MEFKRWATRFACAALIVAMAITLTTRNHEVVASDHDDGETQIKSRNLSLTDLYVFREDWQTGNAADAGNLIFVMNTNPRSLPRQHYYFNTEALYNFHVGRQATVDSTVTGQEDLRFEFQFGAPDVNNQQSIQMNVTTFSNGVAQATNTSTGGVTTAANPGIGNPNPTPITNTFTVNGTNINVFAGLREDPFFFDVEQFFRVRAGAAGAGPAVGFNTLDTATDFAAGYNVNAIVMRVPIAFLQNNAEPVFDVWETITLPADLAARQ